MKIRCEFLFLREVPLQSGIHDLFFLLQVSIYIHEETSLAHPRGARRTGSVGPLLSRRAGRLRTFKKVQNGTPHFTKIGFGVDAGPVGTFVQDSDHRNRIRVLDASGQVKLAGYRDNSLGSVFQNDSPGQCTARGHRNLQMILIREFNQIFDLAFSAAFAVSDIPCDLNLAIKILNAVRKKDQKFFGPDLVPVGSNEVVVQFHKRLLHFLFRYPDKFSHQNHERKKDFCDNTP